MIVSRRKKKDRKSGKEKRNGKQKKGNKSDNVKMWKKDFRS